MAMNILHVSAECYPVAKAGGLGDVVGALPKYQNKAGNEAKVVMPMYRTKFLYSHQWDLVHEGRQQMGAFGFSYNIIREKNTELGFDLYLVDVNGLLDRDKIYGYNDDTERFVAFQIAVCDWLSSWKVPPDIVHCHDHHTGLIPFMMQNCYVFKNKLQYVPTVFTVHNGQYQGWMDWDKYHYLPLYDGYAWGKLDWNDMINPLASAVKCADRVTTVSESYLAELRYNANGLENLFEYEKGKCRGILNGIDAEVWNTATDPLLKARYTSRTVADGKLKNKQFLCEEFGLNSSLPLFSFIGRLVGEKAADLLPDAIYQSVMQYQGRASFLILGSGEAGVEAALQQLVDPLKEFYNCFIGYNEGLSHIIYAGSDFLLMPSRVEPCGLNQMYALRYGTIPMVRSVGGLKDTVLDMGDPGGFGIRFDQASVADIVYSVGRAVELYEKEAPRLLKMRKQAMAIDHSWDKAATAYQALYDEVKKI